MDFSSDANENSEGLLEVNRGIFMPQMAEKTSPDVPPSCAAVPLISFDSAVSPEKVSALPFASVPFSVRRTLRT